MNLIDKMAYVASTNINKISGWKTNFAKDVVSKGLEKIPRSIKNIGKESILPVAITGLTVSSIADNARNLTNNIRPNSLKFGSCEDVENTLLEDSMNKYDNVEMAKRAFLALGVEPIKLYKLAKVEPDKALKIAAANFKELVDFLRENDFKFKMSKTASLVSDVSGGDAYAIKVADVLFSNFFPKLSQNEKIKITVCNIASEAMKKEAAKFKTTGDAIYNYLKYIVPVGLVAGSVTAAANEIPNIVNNFKNRWHQKNNFDVVTKEDTNLIDDFGKDKVKKALNTVHSIAPNLSNNAPILTDLVRQVASLPAGGLSVGYLNQLSKINNDLSGQAYRSNNIDLSAPGLRLDDIK